MRIDLVVSEVQLSFAQTLLLFGACLCLLLPLVLILNTPASKLLISLLRLLRFLPLTFTLLLLSLHKCT